ncbi:MAG TPA: hypothetical protein DEP66_04620 [Acidimicrobiaceae bacterium]|nr:hypothetical protein [Acidimicrobiaceae bacterium]
MADPSSYRPGRNCGIAGLAPRRFSPEEWENGTEEWRQARRAAAFRLSVPIRWTLVKRGDDDEADA